MCGIAGIIFKEKTSVAIEKVVQAQRHRGPDNTTTEKYESAHLGHNRLSIIDLAAHSNQPFKDPGGRYTLVFNGEIYNYLEIKKELKNSFHFSTDSDTEVLLNAYIQWGKDCLEKLNGMFAFAVWDKQEKKLFAARDRFGVKPFYYTFFNGNLVFASEIKSLWAAGQKKIPNEKTWAGYLMYGSYGTPDTTFWQDIAQLPGGHYLEYRSQTEQLNTEQWYDFAGRVNQPAHRLSKAELIQAYDHLLRDSINLRFRADVNIGFNVSGGLDSSALLALVNTTNEGKNINAYTFYTGDERYDELPWVEQLLDKTRNPLQKILVQSDDIAELSAILSSHQDEPYGGIPTIAYAEIFKQARRDGVIVLLDGQGMDEQWAGYDYYVKKSGSTIQGVNKSPFRPNVLSSRFAEKAEKAVYPKPFDNDLQNTQYRDIFYTKIPRALRFNDRISMAFGTELREPFLDYRLVETAFSQPPAYKIKGEQTKYLLREIVTEYLGSDLAFAPKRPLQTPQREWLQRDLRDLVNAKIEKLLSSQYADWFDADEMRKEWQRYQDGDTASSFHIWQWMSCADFLTD